MLIANIAIPRAQSRYFMNLLSVLNPRRILLKILIIPQVVSGKTAPALNTTCPSGF
jgi:hypothetical protein